MINSEEDAGEEQIKIQKSDKLFLQLSVKHDYLINWLIGFKAMNINIDDRLKWLNE